jgi:DNA (cytosine-5)-methyltransferase 1
MPTPTVFHTTMHDEDLDYFIEREARSSTGQIGKSLGVAIRMEMLPTPVASEGTKAPSQQTSETKSKTGQVWLSNVAKDIELMGTPRTSSANGATTKQVQANAPKSGIEDQVLTTSWGKFEPAIRRWEQVIGRAAPAPTNPDGKDGNHRLSSKFTEWMMGLPDGWITDVGLTRNEELKACGNGVVPQQAKLALAQLLKGITL